MFSVSEYKSFVLAIYIICSKPVIGSMRYYVPYFTF